MIEFEPPLVGCVISNRNYSFGLLKATNECVINIPTVEIAEKVVGCGNTSGANIDKGLPPEMQARVFDRFVRGDNARSSAVKGCGLGLTIAQWIVQSHGGTIQLTSEPGKTTRVTIRLPPASTVTTRAN